MANISSEEMERVLNNALAPVVQELREIKNLSRSGSVGGGSIGMSSSGAIGGASRGLASRAIGGGGAGAGGFAAGALGRLGLGGVTPAGLAVAAGASVAGAIDEAVFQPAKKIAKDTIFNGLRNAAQFGPGSNPFRGAFNQALQYIPIVGQSSTDFVLDPIKKAGQRTAAITTAIARGGGRVDDQLRQSIFDPILRQENKAAAEQREVERLVGKTLGSDETSQKLNAEILAELKNITASIKSVVSSGGGQ